MLPLARNARRFVERQLPRREQRRRRAEEGRKLRLRALRGQIVLTDDERRTLRLSDERGDKMAANDLADAGNGDGLPRFERRKQMGI